MEFFENLEPMLRVLWLIAIPASIIFIIQSIMTFTGTDSTDGLDADFDGNLDGGHDAPFQLFSFRNLIHFLLGFSWTGISFFHTISSFALLTLLSVVVGIAFVAMFFLIIRQIQKLAEDNSFRIERIVNKTAEVYLTIPAGKSGKGKIQVSVNGAFHELAAVTDEENSILTGTLVRIIRIEDGHLALVQKL